MSWYRLGIVAGLCWLVAACGASRSGAARESAGADGDVITAAELQASTATNLYDYIRAQRPRWLQRARPSTVRPELEEALAVYLDNQRYGDAESLRQIALGGVVSVQYLGPSEAHAAFGPGHLNGVIHVRTR